MVKWKTTPNDYSDQKGQVYFELPNASKSHGLRILDGLDQVQKDDIKEVENGFKILICNQLIPEIVRAFSNENIAIYQVIRQEF